MEIGNPIRNRKPFLDDDLAVGASCYMKAIMFTRIDATDIRWRMLKLRLQQAKKLAYYKPES